jgi:hypothetical protein
MSNGADWLDSAARRAQEEPWTLGCRLSRLAELEGGASGDIAAELNCDPVTVQWIFLCRCPSAERFAQDVERIASRFSLDVKRLAALVRRADAVVALGAYTQDASESILLAARDREDPEGKLS